MAVLKYRGSGGTIQTLLDVTGTLARIGALETKTNNLQTTVNTLNASSGWKGCRRTAGARRSACGAQSNATT